jgi:hypothetical protein
LFNHGYWWEAHEALEPVWMAAGKQSETGQFIQGLIQVAVAHLKNVQGSADVAKRMAKSGLEKMRRIKGVYLGIDVATFCNDVTSYYTIDNQTPVIINLIADNKESTIISKLLDFKNIMTWLKDLILRR